jgi:netrin-G3 ligand
MGTLYVTYATVSPVSITRLTASPYDVFDINCTVTLTPDTANTITYAWMIPSGFTSSDTASSTLTATVNSTPNTYTVTCNTNVTVTGVDGMTIASDSGTIIVKGPSIPIKPVITAISVTPNDAMILWNVSEVTFTPETYVIECGVEMDNFNLTSPPVSTMNTDSRAFTTDNDIDYTQTITGLNIAITYYCHVNSTNTIGTNYSVIFNFTTEETIPHAPNATLVAVSSTSLTLSWKEPKPFTGAITDYNYTCVNVNGSASYTSSDMTPNNPSLMSVTLTGLQPHREYTCNVTASTSKGVGAIGTVNGITNEAAPTGPPLSFIITSNNPNGFTLNWSPPDIQLRNGIIRSYNYSCNEVVSATLIVAHTVTSDTTATVQMSTIKPYTNYSCSVYATTIGSGPSTSTIGTTAEDIPSEVISLVVVSGGDTSFDISWGEPTTPNGVISYYTVNIRHYDNLTTAFATNVTTGVMYNNNDQRLAPEVPYNVSVRAATVAGVGDEVYVINFTREGIPPMVENFNFTRINDTAINVTWKLLTLVEAKGFVNYAVTWSEGGERRRQMPDRIVVPSTQSSVTITGLTPHVSYSVAISAFTSNGTGPEIVIRVPPATPNIAVVVAMVIIGMLLIAILVVVIIILVLLLLR